MMDIHHKSVFIAAIAAGVSLVVGVLIGYFATSSSSSEDQIKISTYQRLVEDKWEKEEDYTQQIINLMNPDNIRENLREFSKEPHLAATIRDDQLAMIIQQRFDIAGFDTSKLVPYKVLLSEPDPRNPNLITLSNSQGEVVFTSQYKEKPLHPDDANLDFVHAFNAYSPAGDVQTDPGVGVIYVNYGRVEDFDKLEELGIDVSGHIVMARYGKLFRGNKLLHAQQRNASGVILFSDPREVAYAGEEPEDVYPNTFWLPGSGMQRGGTLPIDGDPLTPGWPATEHAYRVDEDEAPLPKIPCQPIGYDDARVILEKMGGLPPPEEWKGGLKNIAYNLGPQMLDQYKDLTLRLQVHNTMSIKRSYNVIGTIKGATEPDRYVLLGNHRDAWGYGAIDPSSGTAHMLETARVYGELLKQGWRPRRTLVFCSWGAEESGIIGSTEWVEENINKLQDRAVVYVNTDICTRGPILNLSASPLLWDPIVKILKMVPGVQKGATVYDEWVDYHMIKDQAPPKMKTLGSGSDHAPFIFYSGIPSMTFSFQTDKNKYDIPFYPTYHTGYETFHLMDKIIDPGFKMHQGCGRIAALTLKYFVDSALIPYSLNQLPSTIDKYLSQVKEEGNGAKLLAIYDKFPILEEVVHNFTDATEIFVSNLKKTKDNLDPVMLRAINDQIMKLEQEFIMPEGLPGRPLIRNAVFAPSQFNSYAASGFPGITDFLYKIDTLQGEELLQRHKDIRKHISDLTILMQRATSLLEDFHFI